MRVVFGIWLAISAVDWGRQFSPSPCPWVFVLVPSGRLATLRGEKANVAYYKTHKRNSQGAAVVAAQDKALPEAALRTRRQTPPTAPKSVQVAYDQCS